MTDTFSISVDISDLRVSDVADEVRRFAGDNDIGGEALSDLLVITDELISNVLKYSAGSVIKVSGSIEPGKLVLEFSDDGDPFDPLSLDDPNLDVPAELREIGGLGVQLVKCLTDTQSYSRAGNRNILVLTRAMPLTSANKE